MIFKTILVAKLILNSSSNFSCHCRFQIQLTFSCQKKFNSSYDYSQLKSLNSIMDFHYTYRNITVCKTDDWKFADWLGSNCCYDNAAGTQSSSLRLTQARWHTRRLHQALVLFGLFCAYAKTLFFAWLFTF